MSSKRAGYSRAIGTGCGGEKAAGNRRLLSYRARSQVGLEPFGSATIHAVPTIPVTIAAIHHAPVPPAPVAEAALHMRQKGKTALLAFIQSLVERIGGVRDFLHRRCRGCHGVGAF